MLVVDDDDVLRAQLVRVFERRGFAAHGASDAETARALASTIAPKLAVIDLRMPGDDGLALLRDLLRIKPDTRIVMLTGYGSIATAVEAVRLGAVNYLPKPADVDDILAAFERGDAPPLSSSEAYEAPSLARAEWEHINRVLADCGGNISEAARRLGIHRRSLQRKLQKYPPNK